MRKSILRNAIVLKDDDVLDGATIPIGVEVRVRGKNVAIQNCTFESGWKRET